MNRDSENARQLAAVIRSADRAAPHYDDYAEVYRQIGQRLSQRLDLLAIQPKTVLDLGCGTGQMFAELRKRYRGATLLGLDSSQSMLVQAQPRTGRWRGALLARADVHKMPLANDSVDLVLSNMVLPWCMDVQQVFLEIFRVLKPGGAVFFSTAGPDTLTEYRLLWHALDDSEHDFGLIDMHHLGDAMLAAGFEAPVLDRENLVIDYPSVTALEQELRSTGAVNTALGRRRGLMSPSLPSQVGQSVKSDHRFTVTLELVQGHAWKGAVDPGMTGKPNPRSGEFNLSVDGLRKMLDRWK